MGPSEATHRFVAMVDLATREVLFRTVTTGLSEEVAELTPIAFTTDGRGLLTMAITFGPDGPLSNALVTATRSPERSFVVVRRSNLARTVSAPSYRPPTGGR